MKSSDLPKDPLRDPSEPPPHLDPSLPKISLRVWRKMTAAQKRRWAEEVERYAEELAEERRQQKRHKRGY